MSNLYLALSALITLTALFAPYPVLVGVIVLATLIPVSHGIFLCTRAALRWLFNR